MLDTVHRVETPEGVDLDLRTAGPLPRMLAYAIDMFIRVVIVIAAWIPLAVFGKVGTGVIFILWFVVEWFYYVLFEVLRDGSSPGKKMLDLQVVHIDGTPVGWASSMTRNIIRQADLLPGNYAVGFVTTLLSGDFRRLGDLAAGTLVVYRDRVAERGEVRDGVAPIPPAFPLRLHEQRALIGLAQRLVSLSTSRVEELAAIAAPVVVPEVHRQNQVNDIESLVGVAAYLRGRRFDASTPLRTTSNSMALPELNRGEPVS